MQALALVIAVEDYAETNEFSQRLPGTIDQANIFVDWLLEVDVPPTDIFTCSSVPSWPHEQLSRADEQRRRHFRATRAGIKEAIEAVIRRFRVLRRIDRLFVFIAGHGFRDVQTGYRKPVDLLALQNFENGPQRGERVLAIDELRNVFVTACPAAAHFYFADLSINSMSIEPERLGLHLEGDDAPRSPSHQLICARPSASAQAPSDFAQALVAYLRSGRQSKSDVAPAVEPLSLSAARLFMRSSMETQGEHLQILVEGTSAHIVPPPPDSAEDGRVEQTPSGSGDRPALSANSPNKNGLYRVPSIELLLQFDRIICLGETNGQLADYVRTAAETGKRWKRIDLFSLNSYETHGRPGERPTDLERERNTAEQALLPLFQTYCDEFGIHRYDYQGSYGSLWAHDETGIRRLHMSPRLDGVNIRRAPATDIIEAPGAKDPTVELMFERVAQLVAASVPLFSHDAHDGR
ncbi:MAG: hypothetical protein AAFN74_11365 [Myxococcota bacterium]